MRIPAQCPNCGKTFKVEEEHIGRKGRCPACHSLFVVAAEQEMPKPESGSSEPIHAFVEPTKPVATSMVGKRQLVIAGIAGVGVSVLLTLLVTYLLSSSGSATPKNVKKPPVSQKPVLPIVPIAPDPLVDLAPKEIVLPAPRKFNHSFEIKKREDRFNDDTTYSLRAKVNGNLELNIFNSVANKDPSPRDIIPFNFTSTSGRWQYLNFHRVKILVDTQPLPVAKSKHTGSVMNSGGVIEHITVYIALDELTKLLEAKKIEVQIGSTEIELTEEHIEAMRDFASQLPTGKTATRKFVVSHKAK